VLQTIALLSGSPAIDRFPASACQSAFTTLGLPLSDERGLPRNADGLGCDSGAFEAAPAAPPVITTTVPQVTELTVSPNPATAGSSSTYTISFFTSAVGALSGGSTITFVAPGGTSFPSTASSYSITATTGTASVSGVSASQANGSSTPNKVVITLGSSTIGELAGVQVRIAGTGNPAAGTDTLTAVTSADTLTATSAPYTITAATASPTPTPTPGCGTVQEQSGWNLAGGLAGTVMTGAAALFSLPAGASSYVSVPVTTPLAALEGVWAFYFSPATVTLPCVSGASTTLSLAAGQTALAGNSYDTPASVSGTGTPTWAITFNAATNTWSGWTRIDGGATLTLQPGEGVFVATTASGGSTVTITST
jgi:hypothetical protein